MLDRKSSTYLKMLQNVKEASFFYVELMQMKLERIYSGSLVGFFISPKMCAAINSILHVKESIKPLGEEIGYSTMNSDQSSNDSAQDSLTEIAVKNIDEKLKEIYTTIAQWVIHY